MLSPGIVCCFCLFVCLSVCLFLSIHLVTGAVSNIVETLSMDIHQIIKIGPRSEMILGTIPGSRISGHHFDPECFYYDHLDDIVAYFATNIWEIDFF